MEELTAEMDTLEVEIKGIRGEIEMFRGHGVNNEKNRDGIREALSQQLQQSAEELGAVENEYRETMTTINALRLGISSIFERVRKSADTVPGLEGSSGVSETNMLQYLGFIEQVTDALVDQYQTKQQREGYEAQPSEGAAGGASASTAVTKSKKPSKDESQLVLEAPEIVFEGDV